MSKNYALIIINEYELKDFKWQQYPLFFTLLIFLGEIMIGILKLFSLKWMDKKKNVPTDAKNRYLETGFFY